MAEGATEDDAGHVELATVAETKEGTDTARAVHPLGVRNALVAFVADGTVNKLVTTGEQIFQNVRRYQNSRTLPPTGLVEIGRFLIAGTSRQIDIYGRVQQQTSSRLAFTKFDAIVRTSTSNTYDGHRLRQEIVSSDTAQTRIRLFYKNVAQGLEIVLCVDSTGSQFGSYDISVAGRTPVDADMNRAGEYTAFNGAGYTEITTNMGGTTHISTNTPGSSDGNDGDMWFKYA
ncbi:hypothetical protein [Desulforamulus aquiferis]|uniref:Uncharacterized protein n=1 Tax=Desulforamulus aquiferis TaxID=1397668 RepID=A0AAW7ZCE1_9FIRM|nr:hypothetical protein [Desulforamulus aquiferis]MDO7787113.1 hypothetical protein [Desulforamulus aquiferis]